MLSLLLTSGEGGDDLTTFSGSACVLLSDEYARWRGPIIDWGRRTAEVR